MTDFEQFHVWKLLFGLKIKNIVPILVRYIYIYKTFSQWMTTRYIEISFYWFTWAFRPSFWPKSEIQSSLFLPRPKCPQPVPKWRWLHKFCAHTTSNILTYKLLDYSRVTGKTTLLLPHANRGKKGCLYTWDFSLLWHGRLVISGHHFLQLIMVSTPQ